MPILREVSPPGGSVSLLELLRFYADYFVMATTYLCRFGHRLASGRIPPQTEEANKFREILRIMRERTTECGLDICVRHIDEIMVLFEKGHLRAEDLLELERTLNRELSTHVYLTLQPQRSTYFSAPTSSWELAIAAFPDAQEDVEEMNKCFALSRYTAAVFHSLLVVEHGIVRLGDHIGATDPKLGWDATYNRLGVLLKDRTNVPPGLDYRFLEQTKARLDSMKLAWRNKVNHAGGRLIIEKTGFSDVSAEEIIVACRSFMRHLAEGLLK